MGTCHGHRTRFAHDATYSWRVRVHVLPVRVVAGLLLVLALVTTRHTPYTSSSKFVGQNTRTDQVSIPSRSTSPTMTLYFDSLQPLLPDDIRKQLDHALLPEVKTIVETLLRLAVGAEAPTTGALPGWAELQSRA